MSRRRSPSTSRSTSQPQHRKRNIAIGLVAAVVIGFSLAAPIIDRNSVSTCSKTVLTFRGNTYVPRKLSNFVQSIAIGTGVATGCGQTVQNIDIRSIADIATTRAIAVPTDNTSVYVRRGLCTKLAESKLSACLARGVGQS